MTLVSTAWAIVLSYQMESLDVMFGLRISESGLDVCPVSLSVEPQRSLIDVQRDIGTYAKQMGFSKLRADDETKPSNQTQEVCPFKSIVDFRRTNFASDEPGSLDSPFVLGCVVPTQGKEISLSAWFDESVMQRDFVRCLLSDFEHVLWQMLGPQTVGLCVQDIDAVGPVTQRALVRLNRP